MTRFFSVGASLCAALLFSLLAPLLLSDFFMPVDHALNDWRTRFVMQPRQEASIVLVDVDERSLAELGAWPWPRDTIARLLQILIDDYAVSGIAVDMVFPEQRPNDDALATQFKRPQITGAIVYDLEKRTPPSSRIVLPQSLSMQFDQGAPKTFGSPVVANHSGIVAAQAGHITPIFDEDGAVRRLPPIICAPSGECRPSLELATYASMVDQPRLKLQAGHGWLAPAWELDLEAGDGTPLAKLPLASDGSLVVPYRHAKHDWISISAADILHHKPNPALLKGVIVLMGGTALGLSDVITTPVSPLAAGLEPHAEILSALLDNDFAVVPRWGLALDALLILPFAMILALALWCYEKPIQRAAVFPIWLMLSWSTGAAICVIALRSGNLLLPLVPVLLFPPLALLLTLSVELYRAGRDRAGIFTLLAAYLPRQVANRLAAFDRGGAKVETGLDASHREITVLFADIHGFAGLSEGQPPEVVARLMQRVFAEMAEAVVAHQGTIDKFIGDAIMAFWNAPDDDQFHASHALAAARDMQRRIAALDSFCREMGLAPISIGVGIETGQALVGNFGSAHRRTFTALGEPVVLASRLEGLTKAHSQPIVIGEACAVTLGLQGLRELGPVQIRGRVQPLNLYVPEE